MAKSQGSNRRNLEDLEREVREEKKPTKRLNVNMPASLYRSFKKKCAEDDVSLSKAVIRLVEQHVDGE